MAEPLRLPPSEKVLYIVSMTPDQGYEDAFNEWYDTEHVPELLECPGFESARRFTAIEGIDGSPHYLAVYEMSGMEAFRSPEYLKLRARTLDDRTPLARSVMEHRRLDINAKYREVLSMRPAQG